jgi:hypothetical protein
MPYSAEISRNNPTAFLFAIDRSGSMGDSMGDGSSKSVVLSDVMNRFFSELLIKCTKSEGTEGIRNYFEVGVIGYDSSFGIVNPLPGDLAKEWMNPVSFFESNVLRLEERVKKIPDGAGGLVETRVTFPMWFEPIAAGATPMCSALQTAHEVLNYWCATHPNSYPPLLIHITDGQSTDGDPEELAQQIQSLSTNDGNVLIFNLHLSSMGGQEVLFPASTFGLPDSYAEKLFRMSSPLPSSMVALAQREGIKQANSESRGFAYNVKDIATLVTFLDIGTRAAMDVVDLER